jgi:FKBP-type peptidyl-prolyl cis-trans isomerase FklB
MRRIAVFGFFCLGLICQAEESEIPLRYDQRAAGEAFLAENAKREGVVVLRSGLQYEVIVEGDGRSPRRRDKVTTHYHGTFVDGRVFDSSIDRGRPIEFPVNGVIKGWTEALRLMQVGDRWRLFIPPHLAYGEEGAGGIISPGATLVFEVELLKVN